MGHIDYYFGPASSHTYLAGVRLEEIAAKHGATITYKPVDLPSLFVRTGGALLPERHPSRLEYRLQDLARQANRLGMPMNLDSQLPFTNPAPASYAIIAAQTAGGGDLGGLVHAFTRAAWAEERDIAQDDVICDCLAVNGFDPSLANSGMLAGAETYASNLEEAVKIGVFGAPFYMVDTGQRFWGQDRLGDLDLHLSGII